MASRSLLLLGLAALCAAVGGQQGYEDSPRVKIPQGALRGTTGSTADGTRYFKFLGIPYAKPPVGGLRFAAPQEPESWTEERDATHFGSICAQVRGGSDDCLFVNVFTPQLPTTGGNASLLPVMFYIHGGAFAGRSGSINPGQLMNYGVVLVTINYRLNIFGFLSVSGTDAPGNAGLKDQTAAMRWVQKNIAEFGGDPGSVTIFGESAGSASVHYHVLSPLSRGLFHRAISESGTALMPWTFNENIEIRAYRMVARLRETANSSAEVVQILRAANASDLIKNLGKLLTAEEKVRILSIPFVPTLEFPTSGGKPFLTHEPSYIVSRGLFNKVPYLTGSGSREGATFVTESKMSQASYWQGINADLEQVVPLDLGLAKGSRQSQEVARKVKSFYFGNETISNDTREPWIALQTDLLFTYGVVKAVHGQARHSASPVYHYQFTYGFAGHCAEFKYLLYAGKMHRRNDSDTVRLARQVGEMWTSFAKTGVPSAEGNVAWQPATQNGTYPYLDINIPSTLKYNEEKKRMDFWNKIYSEYSNKTSSL